MKEKGIWVRGGGGSSARQSKNSSTPTFREQDTHYTVLSQRKQDTGLGHLSLSLQRAVASLDVNASRSKPLRETTSVRRRPYSNPLPASRANARWCAFGGGWDSAALRGGPLPRSDGGMADGGGGSASAGRTVSADDDDDPVEWWVRTAASCLEGVEASRAREAWAAAMSDASSDTGVIVVDWPPSWAFGPLSIISLLFFFPDPPPPPFFLSPARWPFVVAVSLADAADGSPPCSRSRRSLTACAFSAKCGLWIAFHSAKRTSKGFGLPTTSRLCPTGWDLHVSARGQGTPFWLITPQCRPRSRGWS